MKKTNDYFTLDSVQSTADFLKNVKPLLGVTCNSDFYVYLDSYVNRDAPQKNNNIMPSKFITFDFYGVPCYKILNQEQNIKYFYDKEELNKYLEQNI